MRTRGFRLVALAVLAALVTALAISATVGAHPKRFHRAHFHPNLLTARMTGAQEVPGPGDPDGRGRAVLNLLPALVEEHRESDRRAYPPRTQRRRRRHRGHAVY